MLSTNVAGLRNRTSGHEQNPACCCAACTGLECLERPRYFAGQLLTEAELNSEQYYTLAKNRLHNRYLHGWGVVCGLQVVCHECEGWVTIKPGYAIDPCGNDIIVCEERGFNVIQAIRECCDTKPRRRTDCDPWQPADDPNCKDVEQHWCITIQYEEREARPTTTLRRDHEKPCGRCGSCNCCCGCSNGHGNGHSNGHKCGCGCHSSFEKSNGAARVRSGVGKTSAQCEPTRILEGYRLCVAPAPPQSRDDKDDRQKPRPGTVAYETARCRDEVSRLTAQAPQVLSMTPAQAHQACCQYAASVRAFFLRAALTRCEAPRELDTIQCPPLPTDTIGNSYQQQVAQIIQQLQQVLALYFFDCLCLSLLPPCPLDPCDDRLILACVTVRNDRIIRICHFEGRRQLLTIPTLLYWPSPLAEFDDILSRFHTLCCGEREERQRVVGQAAFFKANLTTAGISNPGMAFKSMASMIGQMAGAQVINATNPEAGGQVVDTRSFIGRNVETVRAELRQREIDFAEEAVDWWPDEAVSEAARYAPAAVSINDPLTVYTKGELVVGIDMPDETQRLRREVESLRREVAEIRRGRDNPT